MLDMYANADFKNGDDWNEHWSSYADSNARNPAQAFRRRLIVRALDLPAAARSARLLEIGCGQGELSAELTRRYPDLHLLGVDLSEVGVSLAQGRVPSGVFLHADLTQPGAIPVQYRGWASHAVCSEVLEHLADPLTFLRNVRAYLSPGARLVVTVPAGPMSAFDRHIGHRRHFTPNQLRQLLEDAGLLVNTLHGAGFPFFNLYRLTVVARGRRLVEDAVGDLPCSARSAIWVFAQLFRLNTVQSLRGWQLIALASQPG